jgi:ATP-dependent Clp protease adaptor protein ClpS
MIAQDTTEETIVVTTKPEPKTRSRPRKQPPYAVIVENDDLHTYQYVVEALSKIFGYSEQKSFLLAVEVDTRGKAVVWSGTRELAELKRDQIRGYGPDRYATRPVTFPLGVYIEPMP